MWKIRKFLIKILVLLIFPKGERKQARKTLLEALSAKSNNYGILEQIGDSLKEQSGDFVLILDHNWGGGANSYRESRIEKILSEHKIVILAIYSQGIHIDLEIRFGNKLLKGKTRSLLAFLSYQPSFFQRIIVNELVSWKVESRNQLIAPNPPSSLSDDIPVILEQLVILSNHFNAPVEHCFHDYFPLCPTITLLNDESKYCGVVEEDAICLKCLRNHPLWPAPSLLIGRWRQAWQYYFDHIDEVRFFSQASIDIARKCFTFPDEKINLVPHKPLVVFDKKIQTNLIECPIIGIAGKIQKHKGSEIIPELCDILSEKMPQAKLVIVGELDPPIERSNLIIHGKYELANLSSVMEQYGVNIACIPSIWPETFSYVTKEYMDMGIPSVCFDFGAPAERLGKWKYGHVVKKISAQDLYEGIMHLFHQIYFQNSH